MNTYDLQIASLASANRGRNFRRYLLDGVPTIGAFGDEPYELRFYNKSARKIQLRLSIDGTDIITGEAATTEASGKMWVVNAYDKCVLKAWPEGDRGGASFVFVNEAGKTVAAHTHGDVSHRGIIAAAVFEEGYTPPQSQRWTSYSSRPNVRSRFGADSPLRSAVARGQEPSHGGLLGSNAGSRGEDLTRGMGVNSASDVGPACAAGAAGGATMDFMSIDRERSVAGTGAGAYVEQAIGTATGLIKPTLAQVLRVRYLWWDQVQEKLASLGEQVATADFYGFVDPTVPSGFPGNPETKWIDLGNTPRPGKPAPVFDRFTI